MKDTIVAPLKLSAVSYLNTKPFLLGLEKTGLIKEIDLSLEIPSKTASRLLAGEVQLGLVPVAVIPQLPTYQLISNYCIGAVGAVKTVCLYSQKPLHQIKRILLDYHSRTSVQLVQVLCREYWQLSNIEFVNTQAGYEHEIAGETAGVIIGDRTIEWSKKFTYAYDLPQHWMDFTGLPFVFAAWIATNPLPPPFVNRLNEAFDIGMQHIDEVVAHYRAAYDPSFDIHQYLTQYISYHLDDAKREGLDLFLQHIKNNRTSRLEMA